RGVVLPEPQQLRLADVQRGASSGWDGAHLRHRHDSRAPEPELGDLVDENQSFDRERRLGLRRPGHRARQRLLAGAAREGANPARGESDAMKHALVCLLFLLAASAAAGTSTTLKPTTTDNDDSCDISL